MSARHLQPRLPWVAQPPGLGMHPAWLAPCLIALGVYCVGVLGARALLNDGDTFSHIAIGRWIMLHRALPFLDPFSYTAAQQRWVPHEWLAEVILAGTYDCCGWGGIVALSGFCAAVAFAALTLALQTSLGPVRAAIATLAAFALSEAHFLARPHVLAWPLLTIWMATIIAARDKGRVPSLALLPIMIIWCNLHAGFVLGLVFGGLIGAEAVVYAPIERRLRVIKGWGMFLGLAGLCALCSPNGTTALLLPLRLLNMPFAIRSIAEWRAVGFADFDLLEIWIAAALLSGWVLGIRLPLSRALMLLLLLWMALAHIRNKELLGIIAPLLVAAPLAAQLQPAEMNGKITFLPNNRMSAGARLSGWMTLLATAGLIGGLMVWGLDRRHLAPGQDVAPGTAVEVARRIAADHHIFNSVRFGGYLMLKNIPVFIDGRADLYGDLFLARYVAALNATGNILPRLLDEFQVGLTLLEPGIPAVSLLDQLPGWERVYSDNYAVLHRRKAANHASSGSP